MIKSLSFNELVGDGGLTYRPDTADAPGRGKTGVVVIMQSSDVSEGVSRGIPVEALAADVDMLSVARDGIAKWARARNGDFYALMVEVEEPTARGNLHSQLANSIRLLSA